MNFSLYEMLDGFNLHCNRSTSNSGAFLRSFQVTAKFVLVPIAEIAERHRPTDTFSVLFITVQLYHWSLDKNIKRMWQSLLM